MVQLCPAEKGRAVDSENRVFYKYLTAETAIKILQNQTVRYSSPLNFNDPFDVQSGLHFPFAIGDLAPRALERIRELVTSEARPQVNEQDDWGRGILLAWEHRDSRPFPDSIARPLLDFMSDRIGDYQSQCQNLWWKSFLPMLRVFCVTEAPDNLLMWSHYAKSHTGVVLGFRVLLKEDSALGEARPIIYRAAPPPLFSEDEWISFLLGMNEPDHKAFFVDYAYIKSDMWLYEREWRVWTMDSPSSPGLHTDFHLEQHELESVYFGCKVDSSARVTIRGLLDSKYPAARAFQAHRPVNEYRVRFDPV